MKTGILLPLLLATVLEVNANPLSGRVVGTDGQAIGGAMVSAFDEDHRKWVSVFSQEDGSFAIDGLRGVDHQVRARLMGKIDEWFDDVRQGDKLAIKLSPAEGLDLEEQRPANSGFSMLKFDNMRDKLNFKMMCSYCHQIGTVPFRTPEQPVDWETMLRRMDGFGGLYPHTQEKIIPKLIETYKDDAVEQWPTFDPPPPPSGTAAKVKITAWEFGKQFESSFHDLEVGPNGLIYVVNISKHYLGILDTKTGKQEMLRMPRGSWAPHSIEPDNEGHMWMTMCASGQMAKFDIGTKKITAYSSAEAPARRGSYPHTLRVNPKDPEGLIWYTDAGRNSVFSMHPKTKKVKEYHLLSEGQAIGAGKGESRGITPYGLDYSPVDGMIWYSKLNGNRIGRIDPSKPDGDIKEWNPPFRGPRRLHVAPDGIVWVPGFGSGVLGKFDPKTEKWTTYALPDMENQIPYALNIDPKGFVWVCGTGNDTINRFDPKTEELVEIRLPMRVSYTREIEFDEDGNVWTSTSGPSRHMERALGQVIKVEILEDQGGGVKLAKVNLTGDELGSLTAQNKPAPVRQRKFFPLPKKKPQAKPQPLKSANGKLLARIEATKLPSGYQPWKGKNSEEISRVHQAYVDQRLAGLTSMQRQRIGRLWQEKRRFDKNMKNAGASFVKIMEWVADNRK
ncbi:MAG: virginiamycin B lyase family protein [Limisphaerales bacterium]